MRNRSRAGAAKAAPHITNKLDDVVTVEINGVMHLKVLVPPVTREMVETVAGFVSYVVFAMYEDDDQMDWETAIHDIVWEELETFIDNNCVPIPTDMDLSGVRDIIVALATTNFKTEASLK